MRHHEDFESGTADGDRCARENRPLPPIRGGAYAVGVQYGYRRRQLHRDRTAT